VAVSTKFKLTGRGVDALVSHWFSAVEVVRDYVEKCGA
jgi:hypothetical protein